MEFIRIADLIDQQISGEWGKEPHENEKDVVKVIRTTNFTNSGRLNLDEVVERKIEEKKVKKKKLIYGDIIIEKSGGSPKQPVGRVVYFDINSNSDVYLCNNFTSILRPNDSIHSKYLFYGMFYQYLTDKTLNFQNKTTGIINLKLERYVKSVKIPVPAFVEQKKVVKLLDKVQELINQRKEQIYKLDKFMQSTFLEMFGDPVNNSKKWNAKTLESLAEFKSGGTPSRKNQEYFNGRIPWVTTVALNKFYITEEDGMEFITDKAIKESATKLIPAGSILIGTRVGVGKASINKCLMCTNQDIVSLVNIDSEVNKLFILYTLRFYEQYFESNKRGATIQGITSKTLKSLQVVIPPIELQNKFASIVEKTEQQKELLQKSLTEMENNFNSLMQRAFKGELF